MRRFAGRVFLVLLGLQACLGVLWLAQNLGEVPYYGDSGEYLRFARTLEVDAYRGIVYPSFLALVSRVPVGAGLVEPGAWADGPPGQFLLLQILQLLVSLASCSYFLRVLVPPPSTVAGSRRLRVAFTASFAALLVMDPLVAHFDLAIMSDGLALSTCLVFSAALVEFALRPSRRRLSGALLFLSFLAAAGLRIEKPVVLTVAVFGALGCWLALQRGLSRAERWLSPARALQIAGIVLAGDVAVLALQANARHDVGRWPVTESLLHQRVIFPHLAEVYDRLPEEVRSRLDREDARLHDDNFRAARRVIDRITEGDASLRRSMMLAMAGVVLSERWGVIGLDVLKDAAENALATLSFYGRQGVWTCVGEEAFLDLVSSGGTSFTHRLLGQYHPRTTRLYLGTSALLFLFSSALALGHFFRRGRVRGIERRTLLAWVPVGTLVLANAFAFALVADLVLIRYALFAHAVLLVVAYRGALAWLATESSSTEPLEPVEG